VELSARAASRAQTAVHVDPPRHVHEDDPEAESAGSVDEHAVIGMYQDMADAVDQIGATNCAKLGETFDVLISDGEDATARLVRQSKTEGEDFTARIEAEHGPELEHIKNKLRDAFSKCGADPGVRQAFQRLSSLS
jgi:hypothetical protein